MGSFTCDAETLGICALISQSPISVYQRSGFETDFSDEYELILRYQIVTREQRFGMWRGC
jgi:hypothetical protein